MDPHPRSRQSSSATDARFCESCRATRGSQSVASENGMMARAYPGPRSDPGDARGERSRSRPSRPCSQPARCVCRLGRRSSSDNNGRSSPLPSGRHSSPQPGRSANLEGYSSGGQPSYGRRGRFSTAMSECINAADTPMYDAEWERPATEQPYYRYGQDDQPRQGYHGSQVPPSSPQLESFTWSTGWRDAPNVVARSTIAAGSPSLSYAGQARYQELTSDVDSMVLQIQQPDTCTRIGFTGSGYPSQGHPGFYPIPEE